MRKVWLCFLLLVSVILVSIPAYATDSEPTNEQDQEITVYKLVYPNGETVTTKDQEEAERLLNEYKLLYEETTDEDGEIHLEDWQKDGSIKITETEVPRGYRADSIDTYAQVSDEEVEIINYKIPVHSLSISKTVAGNMGNKHKDFNFNLQLTANDPSSLPAEVSYTKTIQADSELIGETNDHGNPVMTANTTETTGTITVNNGSIIFTLKHDESIRINDIPEGVQFALTETNGVSNGYQVSIDKASGTVDDDVAINVVNNKNMRIPTLVTDDGSSYFIYIIIVIGICLIVLKKRSKTSTK